VLTPEKPELPTSELASELPSVVILDAADGDGPRLAGLLAELGVTAVVQVVSDDVNHDDGAATVDSVRVVHVLGAAVRDDVIGLWNHLSAFQALGRGTNVTLTCDVSSAGILADMGGDAFLAWVQVAKVDVLFANDVEAAILGLDEAPIPHGPAILIKQGAEPVVYFANGSTTPELVQISEPLSSGATTFPTVFAKPGVGDAFAAGFLAAILGGARPITAIQAANVHAFRYLTEQTQG
jgi:sugar/nucleoside kinase (ribokinase family)